MLADRFYCVTITAAGAHYDLSSDLSTLAIEEEGGKPDKLTIELSDPFKVLSHALQEGMEVEVDLGTVQDHSLIFRGQICKVEGSFPQDSVPGLRLLAYDHSIKLGLRKRNRKWTDTSIREIVEQIVSEAPGFGGSDVQLSADLQLTGNGMRQQDETDLAFLRRLASRYACELYVTPDLLSDTLHFIARQQIMQNEPEVTLFYGRCGVANSLLSFEASSDVSNIQLPPTFAGIDYATGEPTEVKTAVVKEVGTYDDRFLDENLTAFLAREPLKGMQLQGLLTASPVVQQALRKELGSEARQVTTGFTTAEELNVRAANQFNTSMHGMRASGSTPGHHRIHAQSAITIADVGGRFSGTWYLNQVRHIVNGEGYRTEFQCQR